MGGPGRGPPKPPDARGAPAKPWRPSEYAGFSQARCFLKNAIVRSQAGLADGSW
jgi:hypothetical protein